MRVTDSRYRRERRQFELAMRMIRFEARTCTIRECTGLSDERIRKVYRTYFQPFDRQLRRWRGKPPRDAGFFFREPTIQFQATTLIHVFELFRLARRGSRPGFSRPRIDFGHRVCDAYELYLALHRPAQIHFERAWYLLETFRGGEALELRSCRRCGTRHLHDTLSLPLTSCPRCHLERQATD